MSKNDTRVPLKIWDAPVRLVHWALVALIAFSWWSGEQGGLTMTWHMWSGYAILTLIVFRLLWGFFGTRHARFRDFLYAPGAVVRYARTLPGRSATLYAGHNPLGGLSAILMLISIAVQVGTGLFANDDVLTEGPLYALVTKETSDWLTTIHHYNFWVLLGLAGVHIAAVIFYWAYKRENLIGAMFTGRKRLPPELATEQTRERPAVAVLLLALSAAIVYLVVRSVTWF